MSQAKNLLDETRQQLAFKNSFGSCATTESTQQTQQAYDSWLKTPEATAAILKEPWRGDLKFIDQSDKDLSLRTMLNELKGKQ